MAKKASVVENHLVAIAPVRELSSYKVPEVSAIRHSAFALRTDYVSRYASACPRHLAVAGAVRAVRALNRLTRGRCCDAGRHPARLESALRYPRNAEPSARSRQVNTTQVTL